MSSRERPIARNLIRAVSTKVVDASERERTRLLSLDSTAAEALHHIGNRSTPSVGFLAEWLRRSHSATVRVVDRLVGRGWVVRVRNEIDHRYAGIKLTESGTDALARAQQAADRAVDRAFDALDEAEYSELVRLLRIVADGMASSRTEAHILCRYCDHGRCVGERCAVGHGVSEM